MHLPPLNEKLIAKANSAARAQYMPQPAVHGSLS